MQIGDLGVGRITTDFAALIFSNQATKFDVAMRSDTALNTRRRGFEAESKAIKASVPKGFI